jgi:hypothetical protein
VTVSGSQVQMRLTNVTRATTFRKVLRARSMDTSSAEWIVEAPSLCRDGGTCHTTELTNFGATGFTSATAVTTLGHAGSIVDPAWTPTAINLAVAAHADGRPRFAGEATGGSAATGELSPSGAEFTVSFQDAAPAPGA